MFDVSLCVSVMARCVRKCWFEPSVLMVSWYERFAYPSSVVPAGQKQNKG